MMDDNKLVCSVGIDDIEKLISLIDLMEQARELIKRSPTASLRVTTDFQDHSLTFSIDPPDRATLNALKLTYPGYRDVEDLTFCA